MATQKVVVAGSDVTASQLKDFFRQIEDGSIRRYHFQAFLDHQNPWGVQFNWQAVYEKLGRLSELEKFLAENANADCGHQNFWSAPVLEGVTPNKVVAAMRVAGVKFYLYADDLDLAVTTNDRDPNRDGSYVVHFRETVEADPELAGKSANDLAREGVKSITLLERLLLEFAYFLATGEHLDIENTTLCSGSRYSDGRVPGVGWGADDGEVYVGWCRPDNRSPGLRARAAVS